ncbi:alpha/beta fold hydrolase [Empedobacter sedimenti]|uniref:alpha/beta fold hydrolase n=1 Tax=Empedobacter sedimenti TaxID=3042610 RepID=UPI0024A72204|nr:alpha/beta fold hydrolase [Empedobacter sedimenti]
MKITPIFYIGLSFLLYLFNCTHIEEENHYEKIGQLKLNYTIRGKGPIMIVGHINSGKIGYQLTLKALERKFTMIYYEPRGTGQSESPLTLNEYNPNYIIEEINDLRKHLNADKIWIFGHSDQSAIALDYALKYPNHLDGLILTGTSLIGNQEESIRKRKETENQRSLESEWFKNVLQEINQNNKNATIKWWCYNEQTSDKVIPIVNKISEEGRRKPINGIYWTESNEIRNNYLESQTQFEAIKTKTLIINGKYDTNNPPKFVELLHKKLPNSTLVIIDHSGHFPWIENSKTTFTEINNWLKINL